MEINHGDYNQVSYYHGKIKIIFSVCIGKSPIKPTWNKSKTINNIQKIYLEVKKYNSKTKL